MISSSSSALLAITAPTSFLTLFKGRVFSPDIGFLQSFNIFDSRSLFFQLRVFFRQLHLLHLLFFDLLFGQAGLGLLGSSLSDTIQRVFLLFVADNV